MNFQMFKLVLKKPEEPEIKLSTSAGSSIKQDNLSRCVSENRFKKYKYFLPKIAIDLITL